MRKILGDSATAKAMRQFLREAAPEKNYLIGGEYGTGKGFLASQLAQKLKRDEEKSIVRVKSESDFRKRGSIFTTERRDLFEIGKSRFAASLWLAPLRERTEDLAALIGFFANDSEIADELFRTENMALLTAYWWPYNIHELKRVITTKEGFKLLPHANIDRVLQNFSAPELIEKKLGEFWKNFGQTAESSNVYRLFMESVEKVFVKSALDYCGGSIGKTANLLDIHRNTLTNKLQKLGICDEENLSDS